MNNGDDGSDIEIEYDEDGNPIAPPKKKFIDPLPPIDHSEIEYEPFEKNFYTPHEDIENLTPAQVEELKKNLGVKVSLFLCSPTELYTSHSEILSPYRSIIIYVSVDCINVD